MLQIILTEDPCDVVPNFLKEAPSDVVPNLLKEAPSDVVPNLLKAASSDVTNLPKEAPNVVVTHLLKGVGCDAIHFSEVDGACKGRIPPRTPFRRNVRRSVHIDNTILQRQMHHITPPPILVCPPGHLVISPPHREPLGIIHGMPWRLLTSSIQCIWIRPDHPAFATDLRSASQK